MQGFVKQHLGPSAVSQRDLQRVFKFLTFFLSHHRARHFQLDDAKIMHRCLLLSIAMTYYFRLPDAPQKDDPQGQSLRQQFCLMMTDLQPTKLGQGTVPWHDFEAVLAHELEVYIKGAELPPGIAANLALMENFFCIVVCLQTKTPLIIVGTPGQLPCLHLVASTWWIDHMCVYLLPLAHISAPQAQ